MELLWALAGERRNDDTCLSRLDVKSECEVHVVQRLALSRAGGVRGRLVWAHARISVADVQVQEERRAKVS